MPTTALHTTGVFAALLAETAAALRADFGFASPDIEIFTEDKGDLDNQISLTIGRLGCCVTVMFGDAAGVKANLPGPVFGQVNITVEVAEQALMHRGVGGRSALELAEQAARILHQHRLPVSGRLLLVEALRHFPNPPDPADVCYHLLLRTADISIHRKETPS